jgi:flagellar biosynthesis protein FlhB
MADDAGDKTEAPTPRRRMEARERGQVPKSQDLNAASMLLAALVGLMLFGPRIWRTMLAVMRRGLEGEESLSGDTAIAYGLTSLIELAKAIGPFVGIIVVVGVTAVLSQVGLLLTLKPITPSLEKLSPIAGAKRIFSPHSLVKLAQDVVKLAVVVGVAWLSVQGIFGRIMMIHTLDFVLVFGMASDLVFELGIRLVILLIVLAIIDYAYQRYRHEKQLKMTKEEVKEEMKRMEGDPVVKRRRREVQLRLAAERLKTSVPEADVIVTNPTHYSIAIKYQQGEMASPKVVAKGVDFMAMRIREIASASGIPIIEKPSLARMLYREVEAGQEIPEKFYRAVAEVLAYVYQLAGEQMGPRPVAV